MNAIARQPFGIAMFDFFDAERFMPHGHCYQWDPGILWTSVISDSLIAAAYTAIPFTLVFQIMRKRKDLPFNWMFVCFGAFIVACGLTHLMEIITVWKPYYPISAIIKAVTAAASVPTAIILFRIAPKIVGLPTVDQVAREQTLRTKAEAANEAKDRFIAVLSHELRTPLMPVRAGLELIEDGLGDPEAREEVKETLAMIRNNLEIERALIDDLLDLSSSARGKLHLEIKPTDFRVVVKQSIEAFTAHLREKNIQLKVDLELDDCWVMGARVRLHQIVTNLVSNALKFTAANGLITIRLESAGDFVRLAVKDNGCGIEPWLIGKIFEPFVQGEREIAGAGGMGLGLSIAKLLVELHKGELRAFSEGVGQGATFVVDLPRAKQPPTTEVPYYSPYTSFRKCRLLVVDDHRDTLRILSAILRKAGYEVDTAESMSQANGFLDRAEILVTDIGLPDGNGCDLMKRFKECYGGRGIAISGFGQPEDLERSHRAGFSHHLVKPIDPELLRATLEEACLAEAQAGNVTV